jgi:ataxia telangiectasia mutated family protein
MWHLGLRSLTIFPTCRAASHLLHSLLGKMLVQYHEIGEDVASIITSADVSGPAVLCDSSIILMSHLLHARVTEVPGASLKASQHVIRWLFSRWDPGKRCISYIFILI